MENWVKDTLEKTRNAIYLNSNVDALIALELCREFIQELSYLSYYDKLASTGGVDVRLEAKIKYIEIFGEEP